MTSRRILSAAIAATLALGTYQAYAYDENFKGYEVHNVSVKADAAKVAMGIQFLHQAGNTGMQMIGVALFSMLKLANMILITS